MPLAWRLANAERSNTFYIGRWSDLPKPSAQDHAPNPARASPRNDVERPAFARLSSVVAKEDAKIRARGLLPIGLFENIPAWQHERHFYVQHRSMPGSLGTAIVRIAELEDVMVITPGRWWPRYWGAISLHSISCPHYDHDAQATALVMILRSWVIARTEDGL